MTASTSSRRRRISDRLIMDVASSLTDRDRQILRLLRWHRVLTTTQIHLMFFGNRNTAQHRMTRLHDLRLVARFRAQRCGRDGEYHYVLDVLGAYVVAAMANRGPVREIPMRCRTDWAMSIATSQRLAHTVGANDLFVRLVAAARQRPDAELSTWWGERYCTDRLGEVVRPDGLGVWREGDATVVFCLEYDRGSEQLGRLAKKADDYARLEEASGWAFWVLVVVRGRPSCSTAWPGPPATARAGTRRRADDDRLARKRWTSPDGGIGEEEGGGDALCALSAGVHPGAGREGRGGGRLLHPRPAGGLHPPHPRRLVEPGRRDPRPHGRVLVGQPRRRDQERPQREGEAGRVPLRRSPPAT